MRERRLKLRNCLLAPRALAVISCALALLAVQPVGAGAMPAKGRAAVMTLGQGAAASPTSDSRPASASPVVSQNASRRDDTLLASARHLHILATVEILQRLLLAELRPGQPLFTQAMLFEPLNVSLLDPPLRPTLTRSPITRFDASPRRAAVRH